MSTLLIVIAGGRGFLGSALTRALVAAGHSVTILTRAAPPRASGRSASVTWRTWNPADAQANLQATPQAPGWVDAVHAADVVVNLAGESIADERWSDARKQQILASRLDATRALVAALRSATPPPRLFLSASAVGYYGPHGGDVVTEATPPGGDFLASVCTQWEAAAHLAGGASTRVVCLRTGLVLARDGGALPKMLLPFRLGVGGRVGSGRQYWPWIHRDDWVRLVQWAIGQEQLTGGVNVTAPNPVTNAEFARALGRTVHRPAVFPTPAFALRLALGEMADALLLSGQRVIPAAAQHLGFVFRYERLPEAFASIFTS